MMNMRKFLAALFVFCLLLGGNAAEAALPAPPPIPDSLDNGSAGQGQRAAPQDSSEISKNQGGEAASVSADLSAPPPLPQAPAAAPAPPQNPAAAPPEANQDIPATVANFLSNPASAEEAMRLFRAGDSRPDKTDKDYEALHRLLWYARQVGSADAALTYGKLFDPLEPPWWTVKKDAERALAFYQSAALQNQEALDAMRRLRDWMDSKMPKR